MEKTIKPPKLRKVSCWCGFLRNLGQCLFKRPVGKISGDDVDQLDQRECMVEGCPFGPLSFYNFTILACLCRFSFLRLSDPHDEVVVGRELEDDNVFPTREYSAVHYAVLLPSTPSMSIEPAGGTAPASPRHLLAQDDELWCGKGQVGVREQRYFKLRATASRQTDLNRLVQSLRPPPQDPKTNMAGFSARGGKKSLDLVAYA
ncbi:hypothetical protein BKA80DRAFT_298664 [Phyllosticta citrichinensis]